MKKKQQNKNSNSYFTKRVEIIDKSLLRCRKEIVAMYNACIKKIENDDSPNIKSYYQEYQCILSALTNDIRDVLSRAGNLKTVIGDIERERINDDS